MMSMVTTIGTSAVNPTELNSLQNEKVLGKDLLSNIDSFMPDRQIAALADDEPIFWDILNGSTITYNPMVLFVNYYYWDNLPFYEDAQEYVFEMYANESVIFNSSNPYSTYNEYYWYLGFDCTINQIL